MWPVSFTDELRKIIDLAWQKIHEHKYSRTCLGLRDNAGVLGGQGAGPGIRGQILSKPRPLQERGLCPLHRGPHGRVRGPGVAHSKVRGIASILNSNWTQYNGHPVCGGRSRCCGCSIVVK